MKKKKRYTNSYLNLHAVKILTNQPTNRPTNKRKNSPTPKNELHLGGYSIVSADIQISQQQYVLIQMHVPIYAKCASACELGLHTKCNV